MLNIYFFKKGSSRNALSSDIQAKTITIVKGKAAAMEAICRVCKPPATIKVRANSDCTIPQVTFLLVEGL